LAFSFCLLFLVLLPTSALTPPHRCEACPRYI
jgi:hypothetical protein